MPVQAQYALTEGSPSAGPASPYFARGGGITLSQSTSTDVAGGGVACAATGTNNTTENNIFRFFPLSAAGVTGPIVVNSIDIGIGGVNAPNSFNTELITGTMRGGVNLAGAFSYDDITGVDTTIVTITPNSVTGIVNVVMSGTDVFLPTDTLMVMWKIPDGTADPENTFGVRMGGNVAGETAPTYIGTETSCGPLAPQPVTSIGAFANSEWVVIVNAAPAAVATEGGPTGETIQIGAPAPNPVSRVASVPFMLENASNAKVSVYDLLGREVSVLVDGEFAAGSHNATFDSSELSTGTYVVRLMANGTVVSRTLSVAR